MKNQIVQSPLQPKHKKLLTLLQAYNFNIFFFVNDFSCSRSPTIWDQTHNLQVLNGFIFLDVCFLVYAWMFSQISPFVNISFSLLLLTLEVKHPSLFNWLFVAFAKILFGILQKFRHFLIFISCFFFNPFGKIWAVLLNLMFAHILFMLVPVCLNLIGAIATFADYFGWEVPPVMPIVGYFNEINLAWTVLSIHVSSRRMFNITNFKS